MSVENHNSMQSSKAFRKSIYVALAIGGCARFAFLILFFSNLNDDPDAYRQIAENVATNGVYGQAFGEGPTQPTAFRPPLYPLILSRFVVTQKLSLYLVAAFHFLLGLGTICFGFLFARQVGLSPIACCFVATLMAMDPILLQQSSLVMTETLATFLATVCIWYSSDILQKDFNSRRFIVLGIFVGGAALCRPTFVIWGGLVLLSILILAVCGERLFVRRIFRWLSEEVDETEPNERSQRMQKRFLHAICFAASIGVVLLPWMLRNQMKFGKPIFATTHGGYTIYLGNNDRFYDYLKTDQKELWDGEGELRDVVLEIRSKSEASDGSIDELQKDRMYYQRSIDTIQRRPFMFLYSVCIRVVRFWSVIPSKSNTDESKLRWIIRIGSAVWYSVLFLCAIAGLCAMVFFRKANSKRSAYQANRAMFFAAVLMIIAFQGLHLVYWSNMRMRAPLTAIIAVLAVMGAQFLLTNLRKPKLAP